MGRRKITIRPITDQKLRHTTFNKRKNGLIKKAAELSMLCDLKLLLIFEDTSGALIQYSTHNIFNQFEYFTNFMEDRVIQFTHKDYPNFFKVNHYKKSKATEKEIEKETIKIEKMKKQAQTIPKFEAKSYFEASPMNKKREMLGDHSLEPMKTDSIQSLESCLTQTPEPHPDYKKKNIKGLSINIPDKNNKFLEFQMNTLNMKSTSGFANIMPNGMKLPSPQPMMRIPSPQMKAPPSPSGLTKSSSKFPPSTFTKSVKLTDTPNFFNFTNDFFFNTNYDPSKQSELPGYLDSANANANQMNNAQIACMNNGQMSQAQINAQIQMNAQMNAGQMSAQMNAPIGTGNGGFYKLGSFFDQLDSPYQKYNINQKFIYPFMNFNSGNNEEGFSPFLKNNMVLDLNPNSTMLKKDKSSYFTFKNDAGPTGNANTNANGIPSGSTNANQNANLNPNASGNGNSGKDNSVGGPFTNDQSMEHNANYKQDNYLDDKMRPKKKQKV